MAIAMIPTRAMRTLLIVIAAFCACGPVNYVSQVTRTADSAVEKARAVEAEKFAPYHYAKALAYLKKAREQAASADYESANAFGKVAAREAEAAHEKALRTKGESQRSGPDDDSAEDER